MFSSTCGHRGLRYFDDYSKWKDDLNFSTARASYSSAMNLEPEYLSWSADDSNLFVNLQENNAVAIINAACR